MYAGARISGGTPQVRVLQPNNSRYFSFFLVFVMGEQSYDSFFFWHTWDHVISEWVGSYARMSWLHVMMGRVVLMNVCCSVLQCVAVCCSVLQCVAVCCSVCRLDEWVRSCMWMNHVALLNESCRTFEWTCRTFEWWTLHIWMRHVTHIFASCHA